MTVLYPEGYSDFSPRLTMAQLQAKHRPKMETEYAERFFAMIEAAAGLVGIGGGWRAVQPVKPGFAPPGRSFHETQKWSDGQAAYAAIDTIGVNGRHQDAWAWLTANVAQFGLCTFRDVNSEPWHVQVNDVPKGVSSWMVAGRPNPNPNFLIPGKPPVIIPPKPPEVIAVADKLEFVTPERWDTRGFGEPLPAGQYGVAFTGSKGKLGAKVNILVTGAPVAGYATAWKGDVPAPNVSCLNYQSGVPISNQIDVPLASDGTFKVYISTPGHITCDLIGYWT